ncbi:ABC transporter permease [Mucilaginibacter sp. CSA2-8R]|uniref:ABC transporter permease n=1 Tax=Mucilaginibacter sp. CSA2-8R TaxID=3141542 RepID=UPI00315CC60E
MFKIYLKTAWRSLVKQKAVSAIHLAGLSVGIAVTLLLGLWVWDELSFNKSFKNYDHIAQVEQNVNNNGEVQTWSPTPYPLAAELRKTYGSDFKHVVLSTGTGKHLLLVGDKKLRLPGMFIEADGPMMFSLHLLQGDINALQDPSSVLISASAAKAYFGNSNSLQKIIKIDNQVDVKVAGVFDDLPNNTSFAGLAFMASWQIYFNNTDWIKNTPEPWRPNAFTTWVQLADNADIDQVSHKIKDAKMRNLSGALVKQKPVLFLHPMAKWHLYEDFKNGINTGGSIQYVRMFSIIGIFVLLLACINFMNLSTARSEKRAREVGVRKAIGSARQQLILQFYTESALFVMLAFVLALIWVLMGLPLFNQLAEKQITLPWQQPLFWLTCLALSALIALVAGSYPALYLSSFKPVKVLKGAFKADLLSAAPRKVLVVVQFSVSVILIIGTVVVFKQIQYAKNRPIGYDNNSLVSIPASAAVQQHFDVIESELLNKHAISAMSLAGAPPTEIYSTSSGFVWPGKDPDMNIDFQTNDVSLDYGQTIGWEFVAGRDFSKKFATDSTAAIVNETAVKFMGLENPVGQTITADGTPIHIIGVIKDMVIQSPFEPIKPTIYGLSANPGGVVLLKLNPNVDATSSLKQIESIFKTYNPTGLFEYQFVDDQYAQKFSSGQRIGKLSFFFAALAIFISCLGMFGMATFMAEQRFKEIGIRKVLGASVAQVWLLLSKEFIVIAVIALVIASPIAYYVMHQWLQNFYYRSAISWWIFAIAGISITLITLVTVSYQSIQAALANPVKTLKNE